MCRSSACSRTMSSSLDARTVREVVSNPCGRRSSGGRTSDERPGSGELNHISRSPLVEVTATARLTSRGRDESRWAKLGPGSTLIPLQPAS